MRTTSTMLCGVLLSQLFAGAGACQEGPVSPSGETQVRITTFAKGLEHPWSLAFLPDGRMLVTERPGRMRYLSATANPPNRSRACQQCSRTARAACST